MSTCEKKSYKVGIPELPQLEKLTEILSSIWTSKQVSNFGPFHNLFEAELADYLGVEHVILFANGTLALENLIQVFEPKRSIMMPAYSFDATLTAAKRHNVSPVFCDIKTSDGNLDPKNLKVSKKFPKVDLLLGVHSYGFPCETRAISQISRTYDIPVIYDAAHSLGSKLDNRHLATYGEASIISLHATKILSAIEGGAVVTSNSSLANELRRYRNFGIEDMMGQRVHTGIGTNGKMSEIHAAIGLLQLRNFSSILKRRQNLFFHYSKRLEEIDGITLLQPASTENINGSYVPILVDRLKLNKARLVNFLANNGVHTKPYFDTNLAKIEEVENFKECFPNTDLLTKSVLCLPIHSSMTSNDIQYVTEQLALAVQMSSEKYAK